MKGTTRRALLSRGLRSDLIEKIEKNGHTVNNLSSFSKKQLKGFYTAEEAKEIEDAVKRKPIPAETVDELLRLSNSSCCYCADGNSAQPFQIHHIVEHAISQDDSLGNLMVVCPTHHSAIPSKKYSVEEQRATRNRWYAVVEIAREYDEKGIPFPYNSFEAIVAVGELDLREVVEFSQLSPSTVRGLTDNEWTRDSAERLKKYDFLMISGGSGAGKTTLSIGIALTMSDVRVFRYNFPRSADNREITKEIMLFLSLAVKPTVLLLDDANLWLNRDDLKKIVRSATPLTRVLATITQDGPISNDHDPEAGYFENRLALTWERYRPYVTTFLKENEPEVIGLLKMHRDGSHLDEIRIDDMGPSLDFRMRQYGDEAKSVWQFMYLLRAGWNSVNNEVQELIASDRADVLIACIAIEQIAEPERPMSPDQVRERASTVKNAFAGPVDLEWVELVLEKLFKRRVLSKLRGRYITVHREWARAFLAASLSNEKSKESTEQLLAREFDLAGSSPDRLAALISWLNARSDAGQEFVKKWIDAQTSEAWSRWLGVALGKGLSIAGPVASVLRRLYWTDEWKATISEALADHDEAIVGLLCAATAEDWNHIDNLLAVLPDDQCSRVVRSWDAKSVGELIANSHPDQYYSISWLLGGNLCKHSKSWCREVGRSIDWSVMKLQLDHVRMGDVENIHECMSILDRLQVPMMRSMVSDFADAVQKALSGARISDWRVDAVGINFTFEAFPVEVGKIISALDAKQVAADVSNIPPHRWSDLMQIFWLTKRNGSAFAVEVFDELDVSQLVVVLKKYAPAHPRTLLPMLYLLKYAERGRRKEIARDIYEAVRLACQNENESGREQILQSYNEVNGAQGKRLVAELGLSIDVLIGQKNRDDAILTKPLFGLPHTKEQRETFDELRQAEASGVDYDVRKILWGADE